MLFFGCGGRGLLGGGVSFECGDIVDEGGRTYFRELDRVRLRVGLSSAQLESGRDMLLGVLGTIGDAARHEAHSWRRIVRLNAGENRIVKPRIFIK